MKTSIAILGSSLLAITPLAAAADQCKNIDTELVGRIAPCAESPVGLCAPATARGGLLKGEKNFVFQGLAPAAGLAPLEPATVLSYSGPVVYHMGDTEVFAGMALVNELYQPAIGIVPIGDRFTMGAKTAAFACNTFFHFKTVIPCHYGTFPGMLDADASKFVAEMSGHNVAVPAIGAAIEI